MLEEDLKRQKMQERSPCDQIGWKQEQESGQDLSLERELWRGNVPSPWEAPSPVGKSAKTERKLQRLRGEHSRWNRETSTGVLCHHPVIPATTLCSPIQDAWLLVCSGTECQTPTSEDRPREKTGVICAETAAVAKVWSNPSQNWRCVQEVSRSTTEVPLLMCMPKGRGGACYSSLILKVLTKGAAPCLWTLGACKHWQAANI